MELLAGATATATAPLCGLYSLGGLAHLLDRACQGLPIRFTAHSPRAGFVTDMYLAGHTLEAIAQITRHISLKSLRIYLDVQSVASGQITNHLAPWLAEAANTLTWLPKALLAELERRQLPLQALQDSA